MEPADLNELLARWTAAPPPRARFADVVRLLVTEYNAYEIPLYTNSRIDYTNDEEIREDLIDTLLTITDPRALAAVRDEKWPGPDPADVDEYWRDIFAHDDDPESPWMYRLLITQHALGDRISIVLEREGDYATGFKVYGVGIDGLVHRLDALIGYAPPRPEDHPERAQMVVGDIEDDAFAEYLRRLAAHGVI